MKIAKPKPPGVYIEIRDRRRKTKSECLTIEGYTPKQALKAILRLIREDLKKAG